MSTTVSTLNATAYTSLATGPRRVVVDVQTAGRVRLCVAVAQPAAGATEYFLTSPDAAGRVVSLQGAQQLWGMIDAGGPSSLKVAVSNHYEVIDGTVEINNDSGNPIPVSGASLTSLTNTLGSASDAAWVSGDGTAIALLKAARGAVPAGENYIGKTGSVRINPSATFTRPTNITAYSSGQLVANNTTAGSVTAMSFTVARTAANSVWITRVGIRKSGTGTSGAVFRLHLYRAAPTVQNGDGGTFSSSGSANYLGSVDITVGQAFTDGACGFVTADLNVKLASGTAIFGLLEARGAYTPGNAEVFAVTLEVIQD